MAINCIRFIMGPVHTPHNDLSRLDLASNLSHYAVRVLFVCPGISSRISIGYQYTHPGLLWPQVDPEQCCNIEPL